MAAIRRATILLAIVACATASVLKANRISVLKANRQNVIRRPRGLDVTAAHSLINEPKLDGEVKPTGYKLELEPYTSEGIFKGVVHINITWVVDSDVMSLHAHQELQILETKVKAKLSDPSIPHDNMTLLTVTRADRNPKRPIFVIKLSKEMSKGTEGEIEITFEGKLETDKSEAFFRTQSLDKTKPGTTVGLQLKPNYARRVFPCFDEPTYRTPFDISVLRPKNMVALSNMPVRCSDEIKEEGKEEAENVWDHFERTPPLPTYGIGLVISDIMVAHAFKFTSDKAFNTEMDISLWSHKDHVDKIQEVVEHVKTTFNELFNNFFQTHLPLKKLDLVALPNYMGVKPADSWGLILFKQSELASQSYVLLAQELSYQWLGGLVSPSWWSDAHINKALVGYISAATAIAIDNGLEMDGKWPMTMLYSLYYEFSKRYPHSRITGMKQETACSKIELIFRMFNYTLGEKTFKKGIRKFIQEKKLGTFAAEDIWKALDEVAHEDHVLPDFVNLIDVASSWISKDRLPVVTVERNYDTNTATIRQRIYLRERPHDVPGQDRLFWWIPLVINRGDILNFKLTAPLAWMKTRDLNIPNMPSDDKFIIVNPEEIGPFPVNYDVRNWNMLAQFLMSQQRSQIPVYTRAKLLHDAWNLAYAGDLSFATALNMTLFLKNERDHLVWDPVFTMIDHIGRHIDSSDVHKKFETYVRILLTPLYEELEEQAKDDEEGWKTTLRSLCKTFLCRAGYRLCIEEAQAAYKNWMDAEDPEEGNPVPNQFICPVFKWGTQDEWEFGLQRVINFPSSRKPSERTYLLKTLAGCPITKWKIQRLLNITILEGNGNFTENDIFLIFSMLTGGSRGYTTLFHFLEQNWDAIKIRFENSTNLWDNIISSATSVFTTQEGLDMVTKLYVEKQGEFGSAEHIIEKSLKNIREETKWSDDNLPVVEKWLDNYLSSVQIDDTKFIHCNT